MKTVQDVHQECMKKIAGFNHLIILQQQLMAAFYFVEDLVPTIKSYDETLREAKGIREYYITSTDTWGLEQ